MNEKTAKVVAWLLLGVGAVGLAVMLFVNKNVGGAITIGACVAEIALALNQIFRTR